MVLRGEEVKTLQKHTVVVNESFHTSWKCLFGVRYCVSYPDFAESVINPLCQLGVLSADNSMSWYSGQVAGLVAVNGLSAVIPAQQLILGLFRF